MSSDVGCSKTKIGSCFPIEKTFIKHELDKISNHSSRVYVSTVLPWPDSGMNYLSLIFFRNSRYLATNRFQFEKRISIKNRKYLNSLISRIIRTENGDINRHIFNFYNVTFIGIE